MALASGNLQTLQGKVWDRAARLGIWRMVKAGHHELASESLVVGIAQEFEQALAASENGDFLRDVADASDALEKGDFFEKLNIETQALLIHDELRQELEHDPTWQQTLKRLQEILGIVLDKRQQQRARKALAALKEV